jgi:hypothetical protein
MLLLTDSGVYSLAGDGRTPAPSIRYEGGGVCRCAEAAGLDALGMEDGSVLVLAGGEVRKVAAGVDGEIASLAILSEDPLQLLIGAEPPYVYNLVGDGPAERNRSFADLPVRNEWYTPWGGPAAVRSLACTGDGWVYADIHVGSIMRSADGGRRWEPVTPELDEDVHQVATCPADDDRVYANTANAVYVSTDRGLSWLDRGRDLDHRYGRAIAVHPADPDCILASVSDGPHGSTASSPPSGENVHGGLYRTDNAGLDWQHVTEGYPASTVDNINTHQVAFSADGLAWGAVAGTLYMSRHRGLSWDAFWAAPAVIEMIACGR